MYNLHDNLFHISIIFYKIKKTNYLQIIYICIPDLDRITYVQYYIINTKWNIGYSYGNNFNCIELIVNWVYRHL